MILGEEAADGLAVDLARGEVDQTLAVLRAVLDLRTEHRHSDILCLATPKEPRI